MVRGVCWILGDGRDGERGRGKGVHEIPLNVGRQVIRVSELQSFSDVVSFSLEWVLFLLFIYFAGFVLGKLLFSG